MKYVQIAALCSVHTTHCAIHMVLDVGIEAYFIVVIII